MNEPKSTLHQRLREVADDDGHPLTTDLGDLLGRARQRRTRHHASVAGAVVVTAAALVGSTVGIRAALPDDARPAAHEKSAANPSANADSPGKGEIIRRCLPQLTKYDEFPQYAGTSEVPARQWRIPRDRDYVPGDVVALQHDEGHANPVLCLVPAKGHEQDEVPFSVFEPSVSDPDSVAERCSEEFLPQARHDFSTGEFLGYPARSMADLRDATVAELDSSGPVVEALLLKGREAYSCALSPVTWDAGPQGVTRASSNRYDVWVEGSATGPSAKSITEEDAGYYYAAGVMPTDAARIEFTLDSGSKFTVPVRNGRYAFVHKEPGTSGLLNYDYRVLDADGAVLKTGTDRM